MNDNGVICKKIVAHILHLFRPLPFFEVIPEKIPLMVELKQLFIITDK